MAETKVLTGDEEWPPGYAGVIQERPAHFVTKVHSERDILVLDDLLANVDGAPRRASASSTVLTARFTLPQ